MILLETKEITRQAYLDAMGIQTWFPRYALPNALPARIFQRLKQDDTTNNCKPIPTTGSFLEQSSKIKNSQKTKHINPKDILKIVSIPTIETNKKISSQSVAKASKTIPITAFRLVMLSLGQDYLVVAEMPYTEQNTFTRHHKQLLQNIVKALGLPHLTEEHVKEFVWPLESISAQNGLFSKTNYDDKAASEAVIAYLSKQLFLDKRKVVILFGKAAANFVFDLTHSFEELRGVNHKKNSDQIYAITHGLSDMMKIPSLKPEAWQDLQAIRASRYTPK